MARPNLLAEDLSDEEFKDRLDVTDHVPSNGRNKVLERIHKISDRSMREECYRLLEQKSN